MRDPSGQPASAVSGHGGRGTIRCAIYTRKSSEEGLEQDFNSLHAQREACEAFILSQRHEGWSALTETYDDGGFSGGTMQRPGLTRLMADIETGRIDCVVVYKVDRLTRSLTDFARLVEIFDTGGVSFVSVTQAFNTTSSMGRLTLNVLLSFAQFEREVTGERIRDKIAASKKKGLWMGGWIPYGYQADGRTLAVVPEEAEIVHFIFETYLRLGNVRLVEEELHRRSIRTRRYLSAKGRETGGAAFSRGHIYKLLSNPVYRGQIAHKGTTHKGQHRAIVEAGLWQAVQERLQTNGNDRRVARNAKAASLLAGLLIDEDDRPLLPVHANKDGRRYRYYVAKKQSETEGPSLNASVTATAHHRRSSRSSDHGAPRPALRLAASEIEPIVIRAIVAILREEGRIKDFVGEPADLEVLEFALSASRHHADRLAEGLSVEQREVLLGLVRSIRVNRHELWITFHRQAFGAGEGEHQKVRSGAETVSAPPQGTPRRPSCDPLMVVPVTLCRRGVETRLILNDHGAPAAKPDRSLLKAVARSRAWWQELVTGKSPSLSAIAAREGVTDRYVSQVIELAFLAPALVEAIVQGELAPGVTTKALTLDVDMPLPWKEQVELIGRA